MKSKPATVALPDPAALIVTLRRQRVIFDADLAALYGVTTRALNQVVKRNAKRFPKLLPFRSAPRSGVSCDHKM